MEVESTARTFSVSTLAAEETALAVTTSVQTASVSAWAAIASMWDVTDSVRSIA